jgi:hypothetical protein
MLIASRRALALTLLVTCIAAAPAARAASIGYVETLNGAIPSAVDYNSAGGANSLPGLGNGLHSNVQVNAVDTLGQGHYCTNSKGSMCRPASSTCL